MSEAAAGTVVLGAGLAGLGCARSLPGARVFEARSHPGGHAYSHPDSSVHFDEGAHISHTTDARFLNLICEHAGGVNHIGSSVVRNRWKDSWLTYPVQNHLRELPVDLRARALSALVSAHVGEARDRPANYREWCLREYGHVLTEQFYEVFTNKYWRVAMGELATDWLGGRLLPSVLEKIVLGAFQAPPGEAQARFSRFHYPRRGGFFGFFETMYEGLDLHLDRRVREIDLDRRLVNFESGSTESFETLATSIPMPELIRSIKDVPRVVADAAARLRHTRLLCVNIVVSRPDLTDMHWCYFYDPEIDAARVSFPHNLSGDQSAETSSLQAEIFRRPDEEWNVDDLADRTARQMGALFGFDPERDIASITPRVVEHAYVISDTGRAAAVATILNWLESKDVHSMGLYGRWQYIWSDAAYASGVRAAGKIKEAVCR